MHRFKIVTILFVALLCLGLSARSNAQGWQFSGAYFCDYDDSFTDVSGGASASYDDESPMCSAYSASNNGNGYVQAVYRVEFTWDQSGDTPEDLFYHAYANIYGTARDANPSGGGSGGYGMPYPGGSSNPGYGSSHSDVGGLDKSCPSDYSIPYDSDEQYANPDHADSAVRQFMINAHAYANSSGTGARARFSTPPHG